MISVSIVNLNEGEKLEKCLKSVDGFADEIIVVDLESTDNSLEICKKYNAKFYPHKKEDFVELIRNFSISKANGDWILILDPDEIVRIDLKEKLKQIVDKPDNFVAVNIPRKNIFFNKWIKHTNWWPDKHVRFFKKGEIEWTNKIHSYPEVKGELLELPSQENLAIEHFGYDNLNQFLDRQNRYSKIEARQRYLSGERFSWKSFFWKPLREFLVRFLKHKGFLDGFLGFSLTVLMMIYQWMVLIKLWEIENSNK